MANRLDSISYWSRGRRGGSWLFAVLAVGFMAVGLTSAIGYADAPSNNSAISPLPVVSENGSLDPSILKHLFPGAVEPSSARRKPADQPAYWIVTSSGATAGYVASTYGTTKSVGYSGQPIDVLIGITPQARISGAYLLRHNEPVLTLGISSDDIQHYLDGFSGFDLKGTKVEAFKDSGGVPAIIARATVTSGVIRDAVLRTARAAAAGLGLVATQARGVDRFRFEPQTWEALSSQGALRQHVLRFDEATTNFGKIAQPLPAEPGVFLDVWVALLDPPGIGQNILGRKTFERVFASLPSGDSALFVGSSGLHSHRGTNYLASGTFDRIEVIQGSRTIKLKKEDYLRVDHPALPDAPQLNEMSVFRLSASLGFVPSEPFRVEVIAERPREDGSTAFIRIPVDYALPQSYLAAAAAPVEDVPLWVSAWERKPGAIAMVGLMMFMVAAAFFAQEWFVRRPKLWAWSRIGFLSVTLVFLGWWANGQLSVVQVVAFFHALLNGFRWETFLMEPVIFMLWCFVALGLLFWGRGVYCGWLCPFGALQELLNEAAKRIGIKQIEVPYAIQERLWAIKYTLFMAILGLSFYSMDYALKLAEAEPFKTAISMRFARAWPFVVFVVLILAAGLFIERFYCRYLCPLGAALAIPAKNKLFDWLHRRPQCGRECRFCETQCTVGAIDTLGRINPNECVLCLRCQVILNDNNQCIVLKRRLGRGEDASGAPAQSKKSLFGPKEGA